MADVTLYVNGTDNAAAEMFTSLGAAITHAAASHADLTAYGVLNIEISITTAETSTVTITGFVTDATHYINIYTTAAARHAGEWTTDKYRLSVTPASGSACLLVANGGDNHCYVRVTGVQFYVTCPNDWDVKHGLCLGDGNSYVIADRCLVVLDTEAGAGSRGYAFSSRSYGAGTLLVKNCAVRATTQRTECRGASENFTSTSDTLDVWNCTFKNLDLGVSRSASTATAKNVGFVNVATAISGTIAETTNSTTTPTFATGLEFHLDSTDTTWHDQGTDLSGSFTTDIDGETRVTWDIGCDEYVAAATNQFARPAADRADGNWLNSAGTPDNVNLYSYIDETSYSDSDYIRSGESPSSDTCTVDLSSIATPQAGTVTMRIRARYL